MLSGPTINDLLDYTDWERSQWLEWMRERGPQVLEIGAGPSGDGRFTKLGDLVRHIFSAEKRYIEKLNDRPLTDPASIPTTDIEALFQFGQQSRQDLKQYVEALPDAEADAPMQLPLMNKTLTLSRRKIVTHILFHEIRHWAQIATLLRLNGEKLDFHDFLFSPAMGGDPRRQTQTA